MENRQLEGNGSRRLKVAHSLFDFIQSPKIDLFKNLVHIIVFNIHNTLLLQKRDKYFRV